MKSILKFLFLLTALLAPWWPPLAEGQINYYNLPSYEVPKYGWTNNLGVVGGYQQYDASYTNNINVLSNGAFGDGVHDDTAPIQTIINNASNGSVIYLPKPSAYYLNTNTWKITGNKHIIMRGDYNQSWIYRQIPIQVPIIQVSQASLSSTIAIQNGVLTNGSESVTCTNPTAAMIGNYFFIGTLVAPPDVISNGCSDNGDYNFNHITSTLFPSGSIPTEVVRVTNVVGNVVYFTPPCRWDLTNGQQGFVEVCDYTNSANRCGIENLNLTITTNLQLAGDSSSWATIQFDSVQDCWITGCILATNAPEAIHWDYCSHYTAESNILHHAYDYVGSWGYGYYGSLCDNDGLIENCIAYNLRHAYVTQGYQTCIVYGYDFEVNECFREYTGVRWTNGYSGSFISHGQGIKYGLTEGCVGDFYSYDNVHANASHMSMLRDVSYPATTNSDWPQGQGTNIGAAVICLNISMNNNWVSVIGCVLGVTGTTLYYQEDPTNTYSPSGSYGLSVYTIGYSCSNTGTPDDTGMLTNVFRANNFDVVHNATISDPGVSVTNVSPSYYLLSKPPFFNQFAAATNWPATGPDLTPMITMIPAQALFNGLTNPPSGGGGGGGSFTNTIPRIMQGPGSWSAPGNITESRRLNGL